jgi:hypothetical protein
LERRATTGIGSENSALPLAIQSTCSVSGPEDERDQSQKLFRDYMIAWHSNSLIRRMPLAEYHDLIPKYLDAVAD